MYMNVISVLRSFTRIEGYVLERRRRSRTGVIQSKPGFSKRGSFMLQGQASGSAPAKGPEQRQSAQVSEEMVREELNRVLASHEFRSSKRSQDFLRYVVEHTLNGQADMLKERTIGIEVFGRSTSYEPSDDATVRVKAGDVRKRLGLYYAEQGAHNPVRIEMPAGTYVPEFRGVDGVVETVPEVSDAGQVAAAPVSAPVVAPKSWRIVSLIVAITAIAIAGVVWFRARPSSTPLDQFWAPVLGGSKPVSLCVAFVPVYGLNGQAPKTSPETSGKTSPLRPEDFVLLTDQFVGGGDLIATSRVSAMLARIDRPYQLRIGSDVSFQDLRTAPAILVGYSYTRWKEISSQMRFVIDTSRSPVAIMDNGQPTGFTLPNLPPDRRTDEDYAIVSRVFHPDTHAMLVELAGVTQYGTAAAADLVTSPDLFAEALRDAPAGWRNKNLQLVLHVKVISGTPSSPKVVKTHFW